MVKRVSFKKFVMTLLLGVTMAFMGFFVACYPVENTIYSLQTDRDEYVLAYQSTLDFDKYFSDTYIKKISFNGEEFLIPLKSSMLTSAIDTSSVGEKTVKIKYDSSEFVLVYVVKYQVDFLVDNEVYDTQLVLLKMN